MTTIYLVPRGKPEAFCQWCDSKPRAILLTAETPQYWEGKPISNPACPTLLYPKFAWEEAEPKIVLTHHRVTTWGHWPSFVTSFRSDIILHGGQAVAVDYVATCDRMRPGDYHKITEEPCNCVLKFPEEETELKPPNPELPIDKY